MIVVITVCVADVNIVVVVVVDDDGDDAVFCCARPGVF